MISYQNLSSSASFGSVQDSLVSLRINSLLLLADQQQIANIISLADLVWGQAEFPACACVYYQGRDWPVYCCSEQVTCLQQIPAERRVCILLKNQDTYFGLLCNEVSIIKSGEFQLQSLPAAHMTEQLPWRAITQIDGKLACSFDSRGLLERLQQLNQGYQ